MARIRKPYKYKVFAEKSISNKVGPAKFGTSKLVNRPDQWDCIANLQYQIGAESIIGCMSTQDLNSVFHYLATALGYVYQQGIAEYNPYQDYYYGSVVQYKGKIHILKKEWIEGLKEPKHCEDPNPCNPCGCPEEPVELNTNFEDESTWFTLATVEDLDAVEKKLTDMLEALKTALEKRIDELETELNKRTDELDKELKELVKKTEEELVQAIKDALTEAKAYTDTAVKDLNTNSLKVSQALTVSNTLGLNATDTGSTGTGTAITADSIASAIADDVSASNALAKGLSGKTEITSDNSLTGKGTVANPLTVNTGKGLKKDPATGEVTLDPSNMTKEDAEATLKAFKDHGLLGDGLDLDAQGRLMIKTISVKDGFGEVHQFYAVDK